MDFEKIGEKQVKSLKTGNIYLSFDEAEVAEPKCHTCDARTIRNAYDQPEGFLRHNSKLWQESQIKGIWLCPSCKKAQLMREGKEIKRREKQGEDVSRFRKDMPPETRLTIGG